MSRLLTDSLFSAERRASNATEARYGALLSFEKQPRPSKSAAEESQLLCFYYFYRGPPMEHLQQGPVCADALVPHAHPHINKIRITIKTQPLKGRLQATRATGVPFTRVPAKEARQTAKRTANIGRTKSVKKGTEKKQKSGRKGRPRALRSLASAALRKKEKRERRTSQASAAEQTKLNKRSSRLIRPAWLAERSSPTRFRPKDDPRATKKKNRQKKARERPQEVLPFSRQGGDASLLPLF